MMCLDLVPLVRLCIQSESSMICEESVKVKRHSTRSKLKLRGYDLLEVRRILAKYPWHRRSELIVPVKKVKKQVVALKLPFSPNAIQIKAASIFRSFEHLLPGRIRATFRPLVAWETSPNLFRIRYSRFC